MNLTRLKLVSGADKIAVTLPRGSVTLFEKENSKMAKAFFEDYSRYGRDCIRSGMLWGSVLTVAAALAIKKYKDKKAKKKQEEETEDEGIDAE